MKFFHALIVMVMPLTFFQASAGTQAKTDSNQPKIPANIDNPFMKVGEQFLVARSRILQAGWHPIRMHENDGYEYFGAERELTDQKFLEVDSCSMDAGALCILYYSKGSKCLRVDTAGERLNQMKVTRWTDECPVEYR